MNYLDFELEISAGAGRKYPVRVVHSPAGEARETMNFPFDTLALESRLKDLQIALLRSGGKTRRAPLPEEQAVQDFGRALFDALFIGEVRTRYDMSWREAVQKDLGLRLKLRIQSPALAALPWEFLFDSRQAEYVCLSRNTPIVRYPEIPQPIQPLPVTPPLRILGMAVSPNDPRLGQLDVQREKQHVENATKDLRARGLLELTWLNGQTWRDLQKAMGVNKGPWHIFHFIGHGGFDKNTDEGLIYLANETGESERLTATSLGRLLADHRSLRLVLLNACEGARGSDLDLFSSTAAILVRRGLPAVLAMQYSITDHAAIELSRAFYDVLAEGLAVDTAVVEARKAVSFAVTNTIEWGTPVLYMRAPDGQLFNFTKAQIAPPEPPQTDQEEQRRIAFENLLREAVQALAQEEWQLAQEKYQRLLELQPHHPMAQTGLKRAQKEKQLAALYAEAKKHEAAKRWSQALMVFEKIHSLSINYKDVKYSIDTIKQSLANQATRAKEEQQRVELKNLLRKAKQAISRDDLSVAFQAYQSILELEPNHSIALSEIARLEKESDLKQFYLEAEQHYVAKRWSQAKISLKKVNALSKNYKNAAKLLTSIEKNLALENRRAKVQELLREAETAATTEDWPNAIQKMEELLTLEPKNLEAKNILRSAQEEQRLAVLYNDAQSFLREQRWQQAIAALDRIKKLRGVYKDLEAHMTHAREALQPEPQAAQRQTEPPIMHSPSTLQSKTPGQSTVRIKRGIWLGLGIVVVGIIVSLIIVYPASQNSEHQNNTPPPPNTLSKNDAEDTKAPEGMMLIPAGMFTMGSNDGERDEKPLHQVTIAAFYLDTHEVTVALYQKFLAENPNQDKPSNWTEQLKNLNRPVVYVSWNDVMAYCNWLSRVRGKRVRLPTEAEWEYAARGGLIGKKYPWGDKINASNANYDVNGRRGAGRDDTKRYLREVGSYVANGYRLYDMAGNVWEWCADWYAYDYYKTSPSKNPQGIERGTHRVLRGGSWSSNSNYLRCAVRINYLPTKRYSVAGFRCAQDVH